MSMTLIRLISDIPSEIVNVTDGNLFFELSIDSNGNFLKVLDRVFCPDNYKAIYDIHERPMIKIKCKVLVDKYNGVLPAIITISIVTFIIILFLCLGTRNDPIKYRFKVYRPN